MIIIDNKLVETVTATWYDDPDNFDTRLHALSSHYKFTDLNSEFIVVNPRFDPDILQHIDTAVSMDNRCIIWAHNDTWIAKKFTASWTVDASWAICPFEFDITREVNPDVPQVFDYTASIALEDFKLEHVYYLDSQNNPFEDRIWIVRYRVANQAVVGTRDMGSLLPRLEYNPDIPLLDYNLDLTIPYYELDYEHVWYLDSRFNPFQDRVWAVRIQPPQSQGVKIMGFVTPVIEYNPDIPPVDYDVVLNVPYYELDYEHVWFIDNQFNPTDQRIWAFKISPHVSQGVKDMGSVRPRLEYNPDIPALDWQFDWAVSYYDWEYTHVWYLDSRFNPHDDLIWAVRITPHVSQGVKNMGFVTPVIEYNPDIPRVDYAVDIVLPYYEFDYEHVWFIDSCYNPYDDRIWAFKISPHASQGVKDMGSVAPVIEYNPDIPSIDWQFDPVAYYDLNYELTWYLSSQFNPTDQDIWVARIRPRSSQGVKHMGSIMPRLEYNPDIPPLNYVIEQSVPYYDFNYELTWLLDADLHDSSEAIWAARIQPKTNCQGVKIVGSIGLAREQFDVVFISYQEPNAEANWQILRERVPHALRIRGVQGIFQAHQAAARVARSSLFWVVDGDCQILDNFNFDYTPDIFDRDCVHVWHSRNPVNGLEYGYGGVKLFPRQLLLDMTTWTTDLTTGLGKLKVIDRVSNITAFNTDAFATWRSAFRETAKLAAHVAASADAQSAERLDKWRTHAQGDYSEYALSGAVQGSAWGKQHYDQVDQLKKINDYEWMKNEFNKFYRK
jgi:hypothetical protein